MAAYEPLLGCNSIYKDWETLERRDFKPTARQQPLIDAARAALAAGLFYNVDVVRFCAERLAVTEEQRLAGSDKVESGYFGYDLYYARKHLDAERLHAAEDEAHAALRPHVGQRLGTIVISSEMKQYTSVTITAVNGLTVTLEGKRAGTRWTLQTRALNIKNAMDRAKERGRRKDDFATFCATTELALT